MNTINRNRTQLSVFAVAALAIVAVAAVMLLAGGVPAQADNLPTMNESVTNAPPQPQQTAPEACTAGEPIPVYGAGDGAKRLALFDVYWDTEKKNLFNNPCPPTVTHVPAVPAKGRVPGTPARDDRSASDVDVRHTIIHIPDSYKQALAVNSADDIIKYPFLYEDALGANGQPISDTNPADNEKDTPISGVAWVLPTCDPDYEDTDGTDTARPQTGAAAGADDLCLIFSAALLNPNNWVDGPKSSVAGDVQYEFESIREPGINAVDRGAVFAFHPYNVAEVTPDNQVTWRTDDADENALMITPGAYEYRQWAFTEPGTYVFQLQVKGHPRNHDAHGVVFDTRKTTTSEVIRYTIHVGLLAELNTRITADDTTPDVGDTVELTITARNEGPSPGRDVKVQVGGPDGQVGVPEGLTYVSHEPMTADYDNATGEWDVGNMDVPGAGVDATTSILTITATVDAGTRGKPLEVTATIGGTETIGGSEVDELDPHIVHHSASVTITPLAKSNTPAEWYVLLSVEENSYAGAAVGDIIRLRDPDPDDELSYNLTGEGASNFSVNEASGGVQIAVASGASLDYEVTPAYELVLNVSDGKDQSGNVDPSTDSSVPVRVDIDDVNDPPAVRLTIDNVNPTVGEEITLTAELLNGAHLRDVEYVYYSVTTDAQGTRTSYAEATTDRNTHSIRRSTAQTEDFFVEVIGHLYNPNSVVNVNSDTVTVTWSEASK